MLSSGANVAAVLWTVGPILLLLLLLLLVVMRDVRRPLNFPPGPRWRPLVGNALLLKRIGRKNRWGMVELIEHFARRYRSAVVGFRLGRELVVCVRGYPLVRQALTMREIAGRPDSFFMRMRSFGTRTGLTGTDGPHWEQHRNFVLQYLKEAGLGKSRMEELIEQEVEAVVTLLVDGGQPCSPYRAYSLGMTNIIYALTAGHRMDKTDGRLAGLLDLLEQRSRAFDITGGTLNHMPWLRYIVPERSGYNTLVRFNRQLVEYFTPTLRQHKATYCEANSTNDLIYAYLHELELHRGEPGHSFSETSLLAVMVDLFLGEVTGSIVVELMVLMLLVRPDLQRRIQAEIDDVLDGPGDGQLRYSDRTRFPLTRAFILEVQRYFHAAAISGPRTAMEECTLAGYTIPKGATVYSDLRSVHMDPEHWSEPERFHPERFLDSAGAVVNTERLLSFSLGKRRCPGDVLAKAFLLHGLVRLLRVATVELPAGDPVPSIELLPGITYRVRPYRALYVPRK